MIIREATSSDNESLLQLTELSPMDGVISLCIHRQPDFFALIKVRGKSTVLVAVEEEKIVGVLSASRQEVWVNKERIPVYYIGDLKVHPAYRGTKIALELAQHMHGLLVKKKANLLFCTTADGNSKVMPFFQGGAGLPPFEDIGLFRVLQILPTPFQPRIKFSVTDCTGVPKEGKLTSFDRQSLAFEQVVPVGVGCFGWPTFRFTPSATFKNTLIFKQKTKHAIYPYPVPIVDHRQHYAEPGSTPPLAKDESNSQ